MISTLTLPSLNLGVISKLSISLTFMTVMATANANTETNSDPFKLPEFSNQDTAKTVAKPTKVYSLSPTMTKELLSNMVLVEGGSFIMGSESEFARKREKPAREVSVDSFYMGKYEVTQDIFEELMGWNYSYFQCANCPMNNVSWFNMMLFIERLNQATGKKFNLPTEAQWAFAAKGGNKSKGYDYSGSNNLAEVAWYSKNSGRKSHPVGLKKPNELGLYDMTGNLWEFCLDDMSRKAYEYPETHNPFVGSKEKIKHKAMKVIRGSGYEFNEQESLIFMRDGATNNVRMPDIGFRLVMEAK